MRVYARAPKAMSARYAPRAFFNDRNDATLVPSLTVFEPDSQPIHTGLLDKYGNELVAYEGLGPLGFVSLQERE